jgi:uncharacterized protein YfaS (alpha-2-macroglobulin family)
MSRRLGVLFVILILSVSVSFAQDGSAPDGVVFRVTEVLPDNGAAEVVTDNNITIIFNRPVVPLTILEERDDLPNPLTLSPEVPGEGEWLNTSIYIFRPTEAFAGGTIYTARVEGVESFDGVEIEPFQWSFRTIAPRVVQVEPEPLASDIPLESDVTVTFNQSMDTESTEDAFSLVVEGTTESVGGSFAWVNDDQTLIFTPDEQLALDTLYRGVLDVTAVQPRVGDANLEGGSPDWTFLTVPLPGIISTDPIDGAVGIGTFNGVSINFASPMDPDTIQGRITVDPDPGYMGQFYSTYNNSFRLNFEADPSTTYTITVEPGMEDVYGNVIEQGLTFSYTTRALDPLVNFETPGEVGFYDGLRDTTEVYVAYRNVETVNLALYQPSTDDLLLALLDDTYDVAYEYQPLQEDLLRTWTIDGTTIPQNLRRYDLLNLGGSSDVESCPGALPSRLSPGDLAQVTTEPDPLRARSEPPGGEIVELMYRDYQFRVVDGPRCIEGIPWFQITLRDDSRAWIAESVDGEYLVDLRANADEGSVEVTAPDGGPLAPGVYFLTGNSPQLLNDNQSKHFMVVASVNVTLKTNTTGLAVAWVTNVHTGEPVSGIPVTFLGGFNTPLGTATSDNDGVAVLEYTPPLQLSNNKIAALVQTEDHFGMGYSNWTRGINPWQFNVNYDSRPELFGTYLYTDRPIYRPNQPVYFRGVLRSKFDVNYVPPSFDTALIRIFDSDNEIIYEENLSLDDYGAFSDTFMLAEDATLGEYRIQIYDPLNEGNNSLRALYFSVAEFRIPEYAVDVTVEQDEVVQGSDAMALVEASYFFGGGVSQGNVDYVVETRDYNFRYTGEGYFSFRDIDPYARYYFNPYGYQIESGGETTDDAGRAFLDLPTTLEDSDSSQVLTVEATVRDETGVSVSGRADYVVHSAELYVGVGLERYINTVGESVDVNLIAVDWDSVPIDEQFIDVEVERWQWATIQEVTDDGRTVFRDELQQEAITSDTVVTGRDGLAPFSFEPDEGGVYKITAITEDDQGNPVRAAQTIWVSGRNYVQWRVGNDNAIQLVADADEYDIGDTARILITSPFQGTTEALITLERSGVMFTDWVTMDSNSMVYEIPIKDNYAPNIFVSVMLVKGVDDTNPIATFRYGVTQLNVETTRKIVNIEIEPDTDQAEPRETVTYTVRTTDYAGEPISAQVGVGLTDLASLSIAPPNSGPILDAFYSTQALNVETSTALTINTDEVTAYVRDVVKGGGGGGGGGGGVFEIRSDFVDTAYWNASLITDENGEAQFAVTLPDNLTTWRLDARAITMGTNDPFRVGQDTFDLISTKPLLVRPVTPRFFVIDDQVVLSSVVNNNTGEQQTVTAFIEFDGLTLESENEQVLTIPDGQRARFEWVVTVDAVEMVDVTFFASADDGAITDASKSPVGQGDDRLIPVYRYDVPETVATAGILRDAETLEEQVQLPQTLELGGGTLTVNVDTSLASVTVDGLSYLRNYPHQCTEQTVSRFLPNIITYNALQDLGLDDPELKAALDEQVTFGLQILYSRQNIDGGWGWFSRDRSNELVTAYVLLGLVEAQEAGYPVSDLVVASARSYLRDNSPLMGVRDLGGQDWQYNREAFILYTLSRAFNPDTSRMANLYDDRDRLNVEGQAFLTMAMYMADAEDIRVATLMSDIMSAASTSATGTFWGANNPYNWTTDTRATSVVLEAMLMTNADSDLIPNVVRYLVSARDADAWQSTQETAWAVMSLTDWMVASNELNADYDFTVSVNGNVLLEDNAEGADLNTSHSLELDVMSLVLDEANSVAFQRGEGEGNLYYTAFLEAYLPVEDVEPISNGIIVSRQYVLPDETDVAMTATVGDIVQVRLTVVVPEDRHYVMIEDPIPAGMEPINPNLLTSAQIGTRPDVQSLDTGWGWWWFSDTEFRDEKVVLYSTFLPAGTYEYIYSMRATVPGTYNVIPTTAQEFYFPEVYGRGAGDVFTVVAVD